MILKNNQPTRTGPGHIYVMVTRFQNVFRKPEATAALRRDLLDEFIDAEMARKESHYKTLALYALDVPADPAQNEYRLVQVLNNPLQAVANYGQLLRFAEPGGALRKARAVEWKHENIGGMDALVKELEEK
jgi:hypothetical protein